MWLMCRRRPTFRGKAVRDSWPSYCEFTGVSKKSTSRVHFVSIALVIALSPLPARAQTPDPQAPGSATDPERPAAMPAISAIKEISRFGGLL